VKQRLITTIFTLLCLTVFSTASYAWRTDWKAKADQMIVVSPEVKAEIAKSPDKAKLNKVVKVGQAFMKADMGLTSSNENMDIWWKDNFEPWTTVSLDAYLDDVAFPNKNQTIGYWICSPIYLKKIEATSQGYELLYQSIIATKGDYVRFQGGQFSDEEYQKTPESGETHWVRLYLNHDNKVYDASSLNRSYAKWIDISLETAKHKLETDNKINIGLIDGLGQNSREHSFDLHTKQLNFLTQANKVCPKY
jgi:hypothetical protein